MNSIGSEEPFVGHISIHGPESMCRTGRITWERDITMNERTRNYKWSYEIASQEQNNFIMIMIIVPLPRSSDNPRARFEMSLPASQIARFPRAE